MKRAALCVALALAVFAGGVFAQDYIYNFRGAFIDVALKSPCETVYGGTLTKTASGPHVYDGSAWITYVCENGSVITRRYLNPIDNASQKPIPVFTVPAPNAPAEPKTVACTVPGMVTSIHGGCVPSNHPDAPH